MKSTLHCVCQLECESRWCCSCRYFEPPPLSEIEIARIEQVTGRSDFYHRVESHYVLKIKKNGYCIFFNEEEKRCAIYDARPLDCRFFPFACFGPYEKKVWIIWDCPYSRQLDEIDMEKTVTQYEGAYADKLIHLLDYDPEGYVLDGYDPRNPGRYRILREINIANTFRYN